MPKWSTDTKKIQRINNAQRKARHQLHSKINSY